MHLRFLALVCGFLTLGLSLSATTVRPPQFTELVNGSDYVVRARVKSLAAHTEQRGARTIVVTQMELDVIEVVAGTPPQPLVLTMLGGEADGVAMRIAGAPQFAVGDEEVLFVQGNRKNFSPFYALMHGRYPVLKDAAGRQYMARNNRVPLSDVAEVALPVVEGPAATLQARAKSTADALSPEAFIQRIRAQRNLNGGNRAAR